MMLVQLGIAAPLKMQKIIDFESLKSQAHVYLLRQSKTRFTLFRTIFLPVQAVYTEPCKFRYRSTVYTSRYTFLQCFFINGFYLHLVQVFTRVRVKVERYGTSQKF